MAGIDNALGISPQVLAIRAQRMNLLTANIANADTPNYKAKDIDFEAALASAQQERSMGTLAKSNAGHMEGFESPIDEFTQFRAGVRVSMDGNSVEPHREHAAFMENAMKYQASLNMLDSRIKGLMSAIKGGQ